LTADISELLEEKFYCSVSGREIEEYAYWSPDTSRIYDGKGNLKVGLKQYKETHLGIEEGIDEMEERAVMYSKAELKRHKIMIINRKNDYRPRERWGYSLTETIKNCKTSENILGQF
jgi:hypothetical protein